MRGGLLDYSKLGAIGTAAPPPEKAACVQHQQQHQTICQAGTGPLKQRKSIHLPAFIAKDFSKLSHVWPLTEIVILDHLLEDLGIALFPAPTDTVIFLRCFILRFAENFRSLCNVKLSCGYSKAILTCRLASKLKEN